MTHLEHSTFPENEASGARDSRLGTFKENPRTQLRATRSSPEVLVVCKQLQCRVVAYWNDPGQRQLEYCICKNRRMADIEINRIEAVPHMQLRIIVQTAATKPFVPVADPPIDHIPNYIVIEMQVECNGVVETYVLRV